MSFLLGEPSILCMQSSIDAARVFVRFFFFLNDVRVSRKQKGCATLKAFEVEYAIYFLFSPTAKLTFHYLISRILSTTISGARISFVFLSLAKGSKISLA